MDEILSEEGDINFNDISALTHDSVATAATAVSDTASDTVQSIKADGEHELESQEELEKSSNKSKKRVQSPRLGSEVVSVSPPSSPQRSMVTAASVAECKEAVISEVIA